MKRVRVLSMSSAIAMVFAIAADEMDSGGARILCVVMCAFGLAVATFCTFGLLADEGEDQ